MYKFISSLVGILTMYLSVYSQIIDVESRRIPTDTNGAAGSLEGHFNISQYTDLGLAITGKAHFQFKHNRHLLLILGDFSFIKRGPNPFTNQGMGHIRYNVKATPWLAWEVYAQASYNELIRLKLRVVGGTGPRFKLSPLEKFKVYAGTSYMGEYEQISGDSTARYTHRLSTYFTFTLKPTPNFRLVSTTYYQPDLLLWKDYRISGNASLLVKIWKKLDLKIDFAYTYDTRPPLETPDIYYALSNGIVFRF